MTLGRVFDDDLKDPSCSKILAVLEHEINRGPRIGPLPEELAEAMFSALRKGGSAHAKNATQIDGDVDL